MKLHEKTLSELDGWTAGRMGYEKINNLGSDERVSGGCIMFYDLKQWAIAVVKEFRGGDFCIASCNGKWRFDNTSCPADEDECEHDFLPMNYKKVFIDFLIDRFELTEEELK